MVKIVKGRKTSVASVKKSKVKRLSYPKQNVALALDEIRKGKSVAEICRKYNVPDSTLRSKISHKYADKKPGPATVLSAQEEKDLVDWIFKCSRSGFSVTKSQLLQSVKVFCDKEKRQTPFTDNMPGRSWYESFLKRHPEIAVRISENVTLNRAKVTEESLRKWFEEISEYLTSKNMESIGPNRVFNCDETGMPLNPKCPSVLAPKGVKNVYNVVGNNEKENITVLVTGNAAGELAPTFILFAGKSLPKNAADMAPEEFVFGYSDNGWMTAKAFFEYIANIFDPWLTEKKVERPVILYMDGHSSHLTLELSKFCAEQQIVLIALPPNATHIMQPLDVSFFRSLKGKWQVMNKTFCKDSSTISIKKCQFAPVLKRTLDNIDIVKLLKNGFKRCGLFPLDVNAVDYTKVFNHNEHLNEPDTTTSEASITKSPVDALQFFETLLSKEHLQAFCCNEGSEWNGAERDRGLYEFWYNLTIPSRATDSERVKFPDLNTSVSIDNNSIDNPDLVDVATISSNTIEVAHLNSPGLSCDYSVGNDEVVTYVVTDNFDNLEYPEFSEQIDADRNSIDQVNVSSDQFAKFVGDIKEITYENEKCITMELNLDYEDKSLDNVTMDCIASLPFASKKSNELIETDDVNSITKDNIFRDSTVDFTVNASESLNIIAEDANKSAQAVSDVLDTNTSDKANDETFSDKNYLKDNSNLIESVQSIKPFLPWPDDKQTKENKRGRKSKKKIPSVVSGTDWQSIAQAKENEKQKKAADIILKKKLCLEKQNQGKLKKESARMKREQDKLIKEQKEVKKEKEKILKQQEKLKILEEKRNASKAAVSKNKEKVAIKQKIEELQTRQAELQ